MADSNMRKVGALWKGTSQRTGNIYYSGKLDAAAMKSALAGDETRLLLFPVKEKRGKGPDVELFAVEDTRQPRHDQPRRDSRVDDIGDDGFGDLP